jgi:hypothetical protein
MVKRDLIRFVGILIIILFFSYFVYPTPIYYTKTTNDVVIKINRLTGTNYYFDPQTREWKK